MSVVFLNIIVYYEIKILIEFIFLELEMIFFWFVIDSFMRIFFFIMIIDLVSFLCRYCRGYGNGGK